MKRYFSFLFCMLLVVVPLMGIPYEQTAEYAQKQAIINERAAKFKAETGFKGSISFNHKYMKFSQIYGTFKGLDVTAPQDTVYMRQVFSQVLAKVSPYISAKSDQLFKSKVYSNVIGSGTIYRQKVNGYKFEGGLGQLKLSYNIATNKLSIVDVTVNVSSEVTPINISMEKAILLVQEAVFHGENVTPYNPRIAYTLSGDNSDSQVYLCYIFDFWDYTVCVDVNNSIIRRLTPAKILR